MYYAPDRARIEVEVRPLRRDEIAAAAEVVARGMRDNPMNMVVYGDDPARRLRGLDALCRATLGTLRAPPLGAFQNGALVGVLGAAPPGACRPSLWQQLRMLPALFQAGLEGIARLSRFAAAWAARHPKGHHWHLGPIAVAPEHQGRGIGSTLMAAFCAQADTAGDISYLETDKPDNVTFYKRFGFETVAEIEVLGVRTWLMQRAAPVASARGSRLQAFR